MKRSSTLIKVKPCTKVLFKNCSLLRRWVTKSISLHLSEVAQSECHISATKIFITEVTYNVETDIKKKLETLTRYFLFNSCKRMNVMSWSKFKNLSI